MTNLLSEKLLNNEQIQLLKDLNLLEKVEHILQEYKNQTLLKNQASAQIQELLKQAQNQGQKTAQIKTLKLKDMNFGYDQSLLRQHPEMVILSVSLLLNQGSDLERAKFTAQEWAKRKRIQPRISCGSVFQALSKEDQDKLGFPTPSAGYIIDKVLNLRGFRYGQAQIAPNHANFIENLGGATAQEVLFLMRKIVQETHAKLGVKLVPEINFLGFLEGEVADLRH